MELHTSSQFVLTISNTGEYLMSNSDPNKSMSDGVNPYQRELGHGNVSILGPTVVVRGELSADEDLVIKGTVEGYINHKKHLTISKQGNVHANTKASSVLVEGKLTGDICGTRGVLIRETSDVTGNIYAPCVSLLEGAKFKGSIDMDQDPAVVAKSIEKNYRQVQQQSKEVSQPKKNPTDTAEFSPLKVKALHVQTKAKNGAK